MLVSDKVSCNNGKDCHYIVGYQVDDALIPLLISTPKNLFSYGVSQYDKNSAYKMLFIVPEEKSRVGSVWKNLEWGWVTVIWKTGNRTSKRRRRVESVEKMHKEKFHGKDVPYDTYCNAMTVLKIDSVFKQSKNYHSQAYVKSREYVQKTNNVTCWVIMMMDFLRCKKKAKRFL